MPQFDVYLNLNKKTQNTIPYLLDVQADLLEVLVTRTVIPLVLATEFEKPIRYLHPQFEIEKKKVIMSTAELAGVSKKILTKNIGSLKDKRHEIIDALDFLLTGI